MECYDISRKFGRLNGIQISSFDSEKKSRSKYTSPLPSSVKKKVNSERIKLPNK